MMMVQLQELWCYRVSTWTKVSEPCVPDEVADECIFQRNSDPDYSKCDAAGAAVATCGHGGLTQDDCSRKQKQQPQVSEV